MDALPVEEGNAVPYRSQNPGKMHACGHDGHVAIGLEVARRLAPIALGGSVKFAFQPAEEASNGAQAMIGDGVLERPNVDAALGIHLWNDLPVGAVGVMAGPVMASVDQFDIEILGRGGHAAAPHQTIDPVLIAAHVITGLQGLVSRRRDPLEPAVVSVTAVHAGRAFNVIPARAELRGTVRTFGGRFWEDAPHLVEETAQGIAGAFGAQANVIYRRLSGPLVNDERLSALMHDVATDLVGAANVRSGVRTMGGEDMAFFLERVPGCFAFVGSAPQSGAAPPHPSPTFDIDAETLVLRAGRLRGAAREAQKPILLDIGAVWCPWCHVMDGESYEDPAIAEILNRDFVCIKVDRDERPDVDARYQRAVQPLSGPGGWPLTAFLTPDGEVFFGGTYFPPDNNPYGRPGFHRVLLEIARAFREEPDRVTGNARAIRDHVVQSLNEAKPGVVSAALVTDGADQMARLFDVRYGGFGTAPKFPHPAAIEFLLARWHDDELDWARDIVTKTLTAMARGGIRDHVGGGFHRYAVDERWIVPHFEKMSYDNSELLHAYLSAYQATALPLYREVAAGIVDWVLEVLADRDAGAVATSQDADVKFGDDGDYWTWTKQEANAALSERESAVAGRVFDIEDVGEMHHNPQKNVLWWKQDPASDDEWPILRSALAKLKAARDRRTAPFVDRTAYVNWNAMMASALLHAGAIIAFQLT